MGRIGPMPDTRAFLDSLFATAVAAAHPATVLPRLLPAPPKGRIVLLAAALRQIGRAHV